MEQSQGPAWLAFVCVLFAGLAGCAGDDAATGAHGPDGNGTDAPDLPVMTGSPHEHGTPVTVPFCGGYTLGVGTDALLFGAMDGHAPPANVTATTRSDPQQEWLLADLPHPDLTVRRAWVHYAYYRQFLDEGGYRGIAFTGTDPPSLSIMGTWSVQNETPFQVVKVLERLVTHQEGAADVLWAAWLEEQDNGTGIAHIGYHGEPRLATAWQQTFGNVPMPPRRAEGEIYPAGKALVEANGWAWSVTAPWTTWSDGNVTLHADGFGRYSIIVPEYKPRTALENALIEWGLPVPEQMFVSLHDGRPC